MKNTFIFDCSGSSINGPQTFCSNGNCTFYFEFILTGSYVGAGGTFLPSSVNPPSTLPILQEIPKVTVRLNVLQGWGILPGTIANPLHLLCVVPLYNAGNYVGLKYTFNTDPITNTDPRIYAVSWELEEETFNIGGYNIQIMHSASYGGTFSSVTYPIVSTTSLSVSNEICTVHGNIANQGSSDVTEYGFVYAASIATPTTSNHKQIVGTGAFTGNFTYPINVGSTLDSLSMTGGANPVWFAAYAINGNGTSYGSVLETSPNPFICLMKETSITLANGRKKKIENITYEDLLLVWNFDEARLDDAKPVWIVRAFEVPQYSLVKFSDGSELGTVPDGKGHRIFNIKKGAFTHMMSEDTPVGTMTFTEDGDRIMVISKETVDKPMTFYNIITHTHINVFANNILTSTGLNNIYPVSNMKFVKDSRKLRNKEEFGEVSDELFTGLRLAEQLDYPDVKNKLIRMKERQL